MDELARRKNTPGTDAAFDTLAHVAVDSETDDRYPSGTLIIPADSPDASVLISRAIAESKPIMLVFPDGSGVVARPPDAKGFLLFVILSLSFLLALASKTRDRPTFVPREWVTEFHAAPREREAEPVG
ncbi:MAG TPA: hypothetical protein VF712_12495 [Thermoleophilaceae bacterium]|jgi:hypothetical protein